MRLALLILLLANLAFLAWARWVDIPPETPASRIDAALPRLVLVSKDSESAVAAAVPQPGDDLTPGDGQPVARCVSVGPFRDAAAASRAADLWSRQGLEPQPRVEENGRWEAFWVYVDGIAGPAEESGILQRLRQNGISDAYVIPTSTAGDRQISLGLFADLPTAERRASDLQRLGVVAKISEQRQEGTLHWVDLGLGRSDVAPGELLASGDIRTQLEIRTCPESAAASPPITAAETDGPQPDERTYATICPPCRAPA